MKYVSFKNLKEKFKKKDQEDQEFRNLVAKFIDPSQLKTYSRSKQAIVLVATNKARAQELFLKKETLQAAFSCAVIIR